MGITGGMEMRTVYKKQCPVCKKMYKTDKRTQSACAKECANVWQMWIWQEKKGRMDLTELRRKISAGIASKEVIKK